MPFLGEKVEDFNGSLRKMGRSNINRHQKTVTENDIYILFNE